MTTPSPTAPDLAGKVVIITGASRGIGAAARTFAAAGATAILAARDAPALAAVEREIIASGGRALAVPADVGDPIAVERLVAQTLDACGRLDAAFNNAGEGHRPTPLGDIAVDDFDRIVRVHLKGVFLCMKYEIPAMPQGGGGAIVNMSSTAGLRGVPGIASYVAAKHAVIGLTKVAALDYATRNIRVNAVAPGPILTDRLAVLEERGRQQVASAVPMGRLGRPGEVAATVAWLLSDHASFISGETIRIDGGRLAAGA
jgi:NAD(P)-dependent dehydrogenase (short-subunit alcohol dehydrogenase family)